MKKRIQKKMKILIGKGVGFVLFMLTLYLADSCLPDMWWGLAIKLLFLLGALYCLYDVLTYNRSKSTEKGDGK